MVEGFDRLMQPRDTTGMRKVNFLTGSHVLDIGHQDTSVIIEIDPMTIQRQLSKRGGRF